MASPVLDVLRGDDNDLIPDPEFARLRGCTTRTLKRDRDLGNGPRYLKIGRRIYYRRGAVREWILSLETRATA